MFQRIFLILACLVLIGAQEAKQRTKKYNISVCALFKNEAKYLKEWIEYHRLVGIDHFYLYNNNSNDRYKTILNPYIKKGIVTLVHWPDFLEDPRNNQAAEWALSTQATAYENAVHFRAKNETKWLAILSIDEFLVPLNQMNLPETLSEFDAFPGIILSGTYYNASKLDFINKKRLIIENINLINSPQKNQLKAVEKMIFKPDQCIGFSWPPFKYKFKENRTAKKISNHEIRINAYVNRDFFDIHSIRNKMNIDPASLSEKELNEILEKGFEIEDQERIIYRFVPDLLQKMGFDPVLH